MASQAKRIPCKMRFIEGPRTTEFRMEFKPSNQIPDIEFLKSEASAFHSAAHRCRIEKVSLDGKSDMPGIPMIVNLAFAAELYFKYLIHKYQIPVTKKQFKIHYLYDLFTIFYPEIQRKIIEITGYKDCEFKELLLQNTDLFDTWRYAYEEKNPIISEIGFMDNLVYALGVLADHDK